jgi:hypothetical protein
MFMTPKSQQALLSPSGPQHLRRDSVTSEQTAKPVNTKMLQIKNLLNPMNTSRETNAPASLASTPAYTVNDFTPTTTPGPETPLTPASARRQKTGKDHVTSAKRAAPKGVVNYKSYGCNSSTVCADPALRTEIINQHANFKLAAEGNGLISDYPKHIPYASGKKDFYDKTGREAFECLSHCFSLPTPNGISSLTHDSLPVHLCCSERPDSEGSQRHVGLSSRSRAHNAFLQSLRLWQGMSTLCIVLPLADDLHRPPQRKPSRPTQAWRTSFTASLAVPYRLKATGHPSHVRGHSA